MGKVIQGIIKELGNGLAGAYSVVPDDDVPNDDVPNDDVPNDDVPDDDDDDEYYSEHFSHDTDRERFGSD